MAVGERVRISTVLGMAVMDALEETGPNGCIMLHGLSPELREQIRSRLIDAGWNAFDQPGNQDARGARDPESGMYVTMWAPRS